MSGVRRRPSEGKETLQNLWGGAVKVFCSWSGGKESCLACYQAIREGHEVASLLTMFTTTGNHTRSHRLRKDLLMAQSQAVGIPLYQRRVSWDTYERGFASEDRAWVEQVCSEAGIVPLLPLWGMETKDLLSTFIKMGFEAIVVAVRSDIMDANWLGKRIDGAFVEQMEKSGIDVCGENGEYHTLVVDGPIFGRRIDIRATEITRRGSMAFLRVLSFGLRRKS